MKSLASTSSLKQDNDDDDEHQIHLLREQIHTRLVELHGPAAQGTTVQDPNPPDAQLTEERRLHLQTEFILGFHFREREYRESAISSPYENTFAWMFEDSKDPGRKSTGFRQWLSSPSDILFWVTGKAGSGKSTLMKYTSNFRSNGEGATLCRKLLAKGAGSSKIATASFYFWASGAEIQALKTALFRSLLFDLLQDNADVIPRIAPAAWESACLLGTPFPQDWTEEMLRDLVVRTVEELSRDSKVCIFIDGLDEFGGDAQTIVSFVDTVLQMPNVKLCVSSRPWAQFQSAFGRASTLRMQDLTYPDIRHFVQTRFDECPGFRRLVEREPGYAANLIHQVVERSSGVFLWVRLVVDSLITGLSNDLLPRDLDTLLRSLPPELDDLYARILDDIDPSSFERACRHFQLLLANDGWAEAMLLSFADEDRGFFREVPFALMSLDEHTARLDALERRLGACCKGLLEVSADRRVNFLHRTVRDFLDSPATRERVGAATKHSGFDAHLQLCSGFYCLIRATAFGAWSREPFSFAALDGPLLLNPDSRAVEAGLVGAAAQVRLQGHRRPPMDHPMPAPRRPRRADLKPPHARHPRLPQQQTRPRPRAPRPSHSRMLYAQLHPARALPPLLPRRRTPLVHRPPPARDAPRRGGLRPRQSRAGRAVLGAPRRLSRSAAGAARKGARDDHARDVGRSSPPPRRRRRGASWRCSCF